MPGLLTDCIKVSEIATSKIITDIPAAGSSLNISFKTFSNLCLAQCQCLCVCVCVCVGVWWWWWWWWGGWLGGDLRERQRQHQVISPQGQTEYSIMPYFPRDACILPSNDRH